jgi:hypothetical protein
MRFAFSIFLILLWFISAGVFVNTLAAQTSTILQQIAQILQAGFAAVIFTLITLAAVIMLSLRER